MKKNMSCMMYITVLAIAGCISIVSILLYRNWARRSTAKYEDFKIKIKMPFRWEPYGETVAQPEVTEAPSTEYTAGDTVTPVEPKEDKPKSPYHVPPGTLGEGGDIREVIPWIELFGPEPGSAASEACEEKK